MNPKYYKPDIDGLRAIAVLGVILFHAGLPLPGGYVGVDVFFVISGYLITQIILRESSENRFTMINFWKRRILRILPASSLVCLTTLLVGYVILDPDWFTLLGKAAIAQSLMVANIYFMRSGGYFAETSELQPLLHTWSLAVEEQFYMFFPLILVFFLRKTRIAVPALIIGTLASLALSISGTHSDPSATFYLLPTRAWELAAGGLLAIMESKIRLKNTVRELVAWVGLAAIVLPMMIYSKSTPFPGLAAIPPVLGTVLLIAANRNTGTFVGRTLSKKYFVAIGLTSYSLYLWHWPVLVFFKHCMVEQSAVSIFSALSITALLSWLSWRFVEIPFRSSKTLRKSARAFAFGAALAGTTITAGIVVWQMQGLPSRIDSHSQALFDDVTWYGGEYETLSDHGVAIGVVKDGDSSPDFVLWGDSHGMVVADLVDKISKEQSLSGMALLSRGRPPVTGLWKPMKGSKQQSETTEINNARYDAIINSGTKSVILIARWDGMIHGMLPTEIDEVAGVSANFNMVVDSPDQIPSPDVSKAALERQLSKMIQNFETKGIKVWLLIQVPASTRARVARDYYILRRFPMFNSDDFGLDTHRDEYESTRVDSLKVFNSINTNNLIIVDPIHSFYRERKNLLLYQDRAFYRDEDHLTRPGADHYLRPAISSILKQVRSNELAQHTR